MSTRCNLLLPVCHNCNLQVSQWFKLKYALQRFSWSHSWMYLQCTCTYDNIEIKPNERHIQFWKFMYLSRKQFRTVIQQIEFANVLFWSQINKSDNGSIETEHTSVDWQIWEMCKLQARLNPCNFIAWQIQNYAQVPKFSFISRRRPQSLFYIGRWLGWLAVLKVPGHCQGLSQVSKWPPGQFLGKSITSHTKATCSFI